LLSHLDEGACHCNNAMLDSLIASIGHDKVRRFANIIGELVNVANHCIG
jgi:hypothetical protein